MKRVSVWYVLLLPFVAIVSVFFQGMRDYLKTHMYGNAKTSDLWHALGNASGKPVAKMMEAWTQSTGYPVVTVGQTDSGAVKLSQARYFSSGPEACDTTVRFRNLVKASVKKDLLQWKIPLRIITDGQQDPIEKMLNTKECIIDAPGPWFKLNAGTQGTSDAMGSF